MSKVCEVTGETKTKIYSQATTGQKCVRAVPVTIKVDLSKFGYQEQALKHSAKVVFCQFRADVQKYSH
jgi:hypothetical protein